MSVTFGKRQVGGGAPCFITFEAGPTHSGLESAKRLVTLAAKAGGDAVKFQILDPDRLVADKALPFSYEVLIDRETGVTEPVTEPLYDILKRRAMSHDEWRALKRHADRCGVAFFATVGFPDEIDLLKELKCDSIKIASADVNHLPLIRRAAESGMCLQLDTGSSSIGEIEAAVDVIRDTGNDNIIIHHCPSGYPARLESINLNVIPTLKRMFPYPIAYSDHTPGWEMDVAALALGVDLIEKSITEDRTTRSIEHMFSLEPAEMAGFVRAIREVEQAMGGNRRILHEVERERRMVGRRSICAARDMMAGQVLADADLDYRRPGRGIPPDQFRAVVGKRLTRPKAAGEAFDWADFAS
jgi:N,N'-diacetyllegionaminate synthase